MGGESNADHTLLRRRTVTTEFQGRLMNFWNYISRIFYHFLLYRESKTSFNQNQRKEVDECCGNDKMLQYVAKSEKNA